MGFDNDTILQQFHFTLPIIKPHPKRILPPVPQSTDNNAAWNVLGLSYTPNWPLHVFFTPTVLEKYVNQQ